MLEAAETVDLDRERGVVDPDEEEEKRRWRSIVADEAQRGVPPRPTYSDRDLDWAFADHKDQLVQLEIMVRERKEAGQPKPRDPRWREVHNVAESIVQEWEAKEKAERFALARVEALRRLGLVEEETAGK
jgi:hypothetical protein